MTNKITKMKKRKTFQYKNYHKTPRATLLSNKRYCITDFNGVVLG
jgi:hypothetical protein